VADVRLWSPGAGRSVGQIFQASLSAMCAYGAAMYVLTHYAGPVLNPPDRHVQQWVSTSALFAGLAQRRVNQSQALRSNLSF
jgi:hypothetical protein